MDSANINNASAEVDYCGTTFNNVFELEKKVEWLPKNTDRKIENLKKDLPKEIRGVIGQIEFSQNNLR